MNQRNEDERFLDDPDELALRELEEEVEEERAEKIGKVVNALAKGGSGLDDLDSLLEESVTLASARKRKNQGRSLSQGEAEALERQRIMEEIAAWEPQVAIIHVVQTVCDHCGSSERHLRQLFELFHHRKSNARKLCATTETQLEALRHETVELVAFCTSCMDVDDYAPADTDDYPILTSLGEQFVEEVDLDAELKALAQSLDPAEEALIHDTDEPRFPNPLEAAVASAPLALPAPSRENLLEVYGGQTAVETALSQASLEAEPGAGLAYPQLLADADSVAVVDQDGLAGLVRAGDGELNNDD